MGKNGEGGGERVWLDVSRSRECRSTGMTATRDPMPSNTLKESFEVSKPWLTATTKTLSMEEHPISEGTEGRGCMRGQFETERRRGRTWEVVAGADCQVPAKSTMERAGTHGVERCHNKAHPYTTTH